MRLVGPATEIAALLGAEDVGEVLLTGQRAAHLEVVLGHVGAAYTQVAVADLAAAIARTRAGAGARSRCWPPTEAELATRVAVRARWDLDGTREGVTTVRPAPGAANGAALPVHEQVLAGGVSRGPVARHGFVHALFAAGFEPPTARVHPGRSPLLRLEGGLCRALVRSRSGLPAATGEEAGVTIAGVAGLFAGCLDLRRGQAELTGEELADVTPVLHPTGLIVRVGRVEEPLRVLAREATD